MSEYRFSVETKGYVDENGDTPHGKLAICDAEIHCLPCGICKKSSSEIHCGPTLVLKSSMLPVCDRCGIKYGGILFRLLHLRLDSECMDRIALEGAANYYNNAAGKVRETIVVNGIRFNYSKSDKSISRVW